MFAKVFKRIFLVLTSLVVLFFVATLALVTLVDPNQYKEMIQRKILAETGYAVSLQGPITWRWVPLSLEVERAAFANLPPFKNELLIAKRLQVQSELWSLLTGKVFVNIKLQGLSLRSVGQGNGAITSHALPLSIINATLTFHYQKPVLNISSIKFELADQGIIEGQFKTNLPDIKEALTLTGIFSAGKLKAGSLQISSLTGEVKAKNGIVDIRPLDINIANAKYTGTVQIDIRGKIPQYTATLEGSDFEINDVLAQLGKKDKLEGRTRIVTTLKAEGTNPVAIKKSLTGRAEIEIKNGKLYGIDLIALLKNAQSTVDNLVSAFGKKQSVNANSAAESGFKEWKSTNNKAVFTPFNSLKGTALITDGVINNPDLNVQHSLYTVTGSGTVNLVRESIFYQASALQKMSKSPENHGIEKFLLDTPLGIKIHGKLSDPMIRPDLENYFGSALKYAQQAVVEQLVDKALEQLIPNLRQ